MGKLGKVFFLGTIAFWAASAQTTTSSSPSTSNSNSTAIVYNNGGGNTGNAGANSQGEFRQYPGAYGVVGTPALPGYPLTNTPWNVLYMAVWKDTAITAEQQTYWLQPLLKDKKRVKAVKVGGVIEPYPTNTDPIVLLPWNPEMIAHKGDMIIGRTSLVCQPDEILETCYGTALAVAKQATGTNRAVILFQTRNEDVTKGKASALGGSIGGMLPNGTAAATLGAGISRGQTVTRVNGYLAIQVICMNDGPATMPALPQQPAQEKTPAPALQPAEQPMPPTVNINLNLNNLAPVIKELLRSNPLAAAPAMPVPPPPAEDACDGFENVGLEVHFPHDTPKQTPNHKEISQADLIKAIDPRYIPGIQKAIDWLNLPEHRKCHVQVEGRANNIGNYDYNAALARLRAEAVYLYLITHGGKSEQIEQFVSLSKDRDLYRSESAEKNRVVILKPIVHLPKK